MKLVKRLIWILIPEGFTFCSLTGKISSNQNRDMVSLTQKNKGEGLLMAGKWKLRLSAAICFGAIALGFSGCTASKPDTSGKELVVYCPHPQDFIDPIVLKHRAEFLCWSAPEGPENFWSRSPRETLLAVTFSGVVPYPSPQLRNSCLNPISVLMNRRYKKNFRIQKEI